MLILVQFLIGFHLFSPSFPTAGLHRLSVHTCSHLFRQGTTSCFRSIPIIVPSMTLSAAPKPIFAAHRTYNNVPRLLDQHPTYVCSSSPTVVTYLPSEMRPAAIEVKHRVVCFRLRPIFSASSYSFLPFRILQSSLTSSMCITSTSPPC